MLSMRAALNLLPLALLLALGACSTLPPAPEAPPSWSAHEQRLNTLDHWQLQGRLNIRSDNESRTVNLHWQQQNADYDISLSGTLGMGAVHISGDEQQLRMEKSGDEPYFTNNPEELSSAYLGYAFPLEQLRYWARGMMAPGTLYSATFNELQTLAHLEQSQWHIEYDRYQQVDDVLLPGRIRLHRPPYRLTFLISEWSLPALDNVQGDD